MRIVNRLAPLVAGLALSLSLGCGGKDTNLVDPDSGISTDASSGDGGTCSLLAEGATCQANAQCCSNICSQNVCAATPGCDEAGKPCASGSTCCSGFCADDGNGTFVCGQGAGRCEPIGAACTTAADCCSLGCSSGLCVEQLCTVGGGTCASDEDCCSDNCNGTECVAGGTCGAAGEACSGDASCCTQNCIDYGGGAMRCSGGNVCRVVGEVCTENDDCCGFNCVDGQCDVLPGGASSCKTVGEPCTGDTDCCSYTCRDDGTGFASCQYLGGCRPAGELCRNDADCCNDAVDPSDGTCDIAVAGLGVGRCGNPGGCAPTGEICGVSSGAAGSNECCPHPDVEVPDSCFETSVGTKRCFEGGCVQEGGTCQDSADCCSGQCTNNTCGCTADGQSCAISDQCCSGICAPDPITGELICNPSCIPDGQACTANGDCCGGHCDLQTLTCGIVIE